MSYSNTAGERKEQWMVLFQGFPLNDSTGPADMSPAYLTGTAVTIIAVLLLLLVSPRAKAAGWVRRCPVCDKVLVSRGAYCHECGSKVAS